MMGYVGTAVVYALRNWERDGDERGHHNAELCFKWFVQTSNVFKCESQTPAALVRVSTSSMSLYIASYIPTKLGRLSQ